MAKRILSAESVLDQSPQPSLMQPSPLEKVSQVYPPEEKWTSVEEDKMGLIDWEDKETLMREISLVNRIQNRLDEAAIKVAPSLLRIVLTVKQNIEGERAQRQFLGEHLQLDFRRISELCLVASSYSLLEPQLRPEGEKEILGYGWSNALKLAYIRDKEDRVRVWKNACQGKIKASYREVLEAIHNYRNLKQIEKSTTFQQPIPKMLPSLKKNLNDFQGFLRELDNPENWSEALVRVESLQKNLNRLKRVLKTRKHI